jgi:hypothetical protein
MNEETQKIKALFILEIMGKPPEYLTQTLNTLIDQMDKEKGVSVLSKNIKEPRKIDKKQNIADASGKEIKVETQNDFYSGFAEIELETESLFDLVLLMFKYMPAHIDIFSPEVIALTNGGWNDILNELARKLHGYDEVARVLQVERAVLENKLRNILEQNKEKEEKGKKNKKK